MMKNKFVVIILLVAVGLVFQVVLYMADSKSAPEKAVVAFAKSYFRLDPSIADMLCSDIMEDENIVADYLHLVEKEAGLQGFGNPMKTYCLYDISTRKLNIDAQHAEIQLVCKKKVAINPLYFWVARLFDLGETYTVDEIFHAVKEEGKWKVCGDFYTLAKN
jgi:hypothetical protein